MAIFRNRIAAFSWGVAAVFLFFLGAMTGILFRDGPPDGFSHALTYGILLVFWAAGIGLLAYVAGKPGVYVAVEPNRAVSIVWRYPFKKDPDA